MNPDDILLQIQQLSQAYVAAGGDPHELMSAVTGQPDEGAGDAADQSSEPQDPGSALAAALGGGGGGPQDQMPMMSGNTPMPDISGMAPDGGVPSGTSLKGASAMAEADMQKRMKKGK